MAMKKNINQRQIKKICEMIATWTGKLTWNRLTDRVAEELDLDVTRQTLDSYLVIKNEFQKRKCELRGQPAGASGGRPSVKLSDALETIERQKAKISLLERQATVQLEKLACALHNAQRNNPPIHPDELFKSLPTVAKE